MLEPSQPTHGRHCGAHGSPAPTCCTLRSRRDGLMVRSSMWSPSEGSVIAIDHRLDAVDRFRYIGRDKKNDPSHTIGNQRNMICWPGICFTSGLQFVRTLIWNRSTVSNIVSFPVCPVIGVISVGIGFTFVRSTIHISCDL